MSHPARNRWRLAAIVCVAVAAAVAVVALPQPALASAAAPAVTPSKPTTKARAACGRPHNKRIRCTMTLKQGAGISGSLTMRITQSRRVVATGHGVIRHGRATLTMKLRRKMTRGRYTVSMVLTLRARMVLRLR